MLQPQLPAATPDELLAALLSRDPRRVSGAAHALTWTRDATLLGALAPHADEIRVATAGLDYGPGLFPLGEYARFLVEKLARYADGTGCPCELYPRLILFDPQKEAAWGRVRIDEVVYSTPPWIDHTACTCTLCGRRYHVREGESHYSWYQWTLVPPDA